MAFKKSTTKKVQVAAAEVEQVKAAVKNIKPADVLSSIATAQVSVQQTLADISSKVNEQITLLDNVRSAVAIEEARLNELHEIDAAAMALDEFEASIEAKKEEWAKAESERQARWTEEASDRQKRWHRESAEYDYATQQARTKDADAYAAEIAKRNRDEAIRQETLSKGWMERENALKAQEKEVNDLRTQVAAFPLELKKAEEKAASIAGNSMKRDYEQQIALLKKDTDTAKLIADAAAAQAAQTVTRLQQENERLQAEVKAANNRAETIAAKAVEASSGRQALEAVERQSAVMSQQSGKTR